MVLVGVTLDQSDGGICAWAWVSLIYDNEFDGHQGTNSWAIERLILHPDLPRR
jgi:hypothetical protein